MIMKVLYAIVITGACTVSAQLSSLIDLSGDQPVVARSVIAEVPSDLIAALSAVTDPRARRGVRHQLVAVLSVAVCAVLAGARSYVAIAEWGP